MARSTWILALMLTVGSMLAATGCGAASLHPSFGQLYRDVNMAQLGAHPAKEPIVRGNEVQAIIERHDGSFSAQVGGSSGGSTSASSSGSRTAGVMPLH